MRAASAPLLIGSLLHRSVPSPRACAVPSFDAWAAAVNISAPKLRVTDLETLRGAVATADIAVGEELCVVPRGRCLDLAATAAGSPCPSLAPDPLWGSLAWYEKLALWLLAEQQQAEDSAVSGYVAYLPTKAEFADAPLEWDAEELAELRYPPVIAAVGEQAASIDQLFARLQAGGGVDAARVGVPDLRWAEQIVLSRAFSSVVRQGSADAPPPPPAAPRADPSGWLGDLKSSIGDRVGGLLGQPPPPPPPPPSDDGARCLMPMLDALNHDASALTRCVFDPRRDAFVLTSEEPLAKGDEVVLSYGPKGNDELLTLFGFVDEENTHDTFLTVGLEELVRSQTATLFASEAEMERRFALLPPLGLGEALSNAELRPSGAPASTWHALRVLLGSAAEASGDLSRLRRPASFETELRAWGVVSRYCKSARKAMGGARKADAAALGRESRPRARLAIRFRMEKKRLLAAVEKAIALAEQRSRRAGRVVGTPVCPEPR